MLSTALSIALAVSSPLYGVASNAVAVAPPSAACSVKRNVVLDQLHVVALAGAPTGSRFACATEDGVVRILDANAGKTVMTLKGHPQTVYGLAFSPNGQLLATGDESARIWIWNLKNGKKVAEFKREKGHIRGIQALAFTPDGKRVVSVGKDDTMRIWAVTGGNPLQTVLGKGANLYGLATTPAGATLTATLSEGARLYAPKTFGLAAKMKATGGQGALDVAANRAGTLAVTAGKDGAVTLWDLRTRKSLGAIGRHGDWVIHVAFAPNGRTVASSSNDMNVRLWDAKSGKKLAEIGHRTAIGSPLAFTGDGRFLLTADAGDGLEIFSLKPTQTAGKVAAPKVRRRR